MGVQLIERRHGGDRDEVGAAEPADLTFDPALLVRGAEASSWRESPAKQTARGLRASSWFCSRHTAVRGNRVAPAVAGATSWSAAAHRERLNAADRASPG